MRRTPLAGLVLAVAAALAVAASPAGDVARRIGPAIRENDDRERARLLEEAVRGAATAADADAILERLLPRAKNDVDREIGVLALASLEEPDAITRIGSAARSGSTERRLLAIEALGRSGSDLVVDHLRDLVFDPSPAIRAAAVTSLGQRAALAEEVLLGAALGDADWRVRSAGIWAIARHGWEPPAATEFDPVPDLVRRLAEEDGRLVDDCSDALSLLLGRRLGSDPAAYAKAWSERTARNFEGVPDVAEPPPPSLFSPLLVTRSRAILFAVSTGESMKDEVRPEKLPPELEDLLRTAGDDLVTAYAAAKTKLDLARVHLAAMLRLLRDGTRFDVAVYADSPTFAFGELVPADDRSRKRAEARVANLSPGGGGNLSDMLRRAFDPKGKDPLGADGGPDTVVLFTDGHLARPGSTDRNEVVMAVRRWNRVRQVRFVVVSLEPSDDAVVGPLAVGPPYGVEIRIP